MIRRRNLARALKKAVHDPGYAFSVFRKRLASYLTYRFRSGYSAYPETVSLFLTYKCNLRCKMCGQWGEDGWARKLSVEAVSRELPFETLQTLIDDVSSFSPALTLFGGEPFLSSQWEQVVAYGKSKGLRINIITNGTLLGRNYRQVVDLGVDELIFSLDGPEELHDEIRSRRGTFREALQGFRDLQAYKKTKGKHNPKINVNTTIFETNYRRFDEVIDAAELIGADAVTFHHLIFQSQEICGAYSKVMKQEFNLDCRDWLGFSRETLPDIDTEYLIAKLHELQKRRSSVSVTVYPNFTDEEMRRYYHSFDFVPDSYAPRCLSPWMTVYIFPNGEVKPCLDVCYVAGNIKENRFADIWNNDKMQRYRSVLKKKGHFPACTRCTEFYRS